MWDDLASSVLTYGRIEEIQQAQVSVYDATTRWTLECRACIRIVNEALDGVIWLVSSRSCIHLKWYIQGVQICSYKDPQLQFAFGIFGTLPLLLKFVIPRYSDSLMLRQYWNIDFVVLNRTVRRISIWTFHITSDHGHLLAYGDNSTMKSHFCTYWNWP
jgi:hypothetical protein